MKKLIIMFLLIICNYPYPIYATSGCCSHHGGVDCTKVQSNGKVVCEDGWKGSTCSYDSMKKCQNFSTSETLDKNIIDKTNNENLDESSKDKNNFKWWLLGGGTSILLYKIIDGRKNEKK